MTTTAQAVPVLEISAPDDTMDVLSDAGYDFADGDGDIDLDLGNAPSVHDDDMSLNDAATDGGLDIHDLPLDQDDYMADHGDLIEEDEEFNNDGAVAVSQTVDETTSTFEADMLAPPDEDLIDYSDDEAQQPVKMHSPSVHEEVVEQVSFDVEATLASSEVHNEDVEKQDTYEVKAAEAADNGTPSQEDDITDNSNERRSSPEQQLQTTELQREEDDESHVHADEDGGILLPTGEHSQHDDGLAQGSQQAESEQDASNDSESVHQSDQQIELRPVTVNYAGNELWLFKQHDLDETGDFLIEDLSVARSSISNLFHACRLSLGDDVSGEHEIGFRFDHLHNLELYEDNTACVAVSLERLVDLYHTLQAQDGNEDPECFYITLQFRPRFATLLADVALYAEQGNGYSALDAAVAAGETHFSNVFSSASTEHDHVEWDNEDDDEEEVSSPGSTHSVAPDTVEAEEPNEHYVGLVEHGEDEPEHGDSRDQTQYQQYADLEEELNQALIAQEQKTQLAPEAAELDLSDGVQAPGTNADLLKAVHEPESGAMARHASESQDERTPDQIALEKQEADDFVDYSDDEIDEEAQPIPAHESSPSSSTIKGDDSVENQGSGNGPEHDDQADENAAETGLEEYDDDTTLLTQTQYVDDANHYAFQDYTETYNEGDPFQDFQADGTMGDPFEANDTSNGGSNQDFAGNDFESLEGEVNLGFDEQSTDDIHDGDHVAETFDAVDDVTHADAFLDLDNAPEWAIDADPASNLPGEDAILLHDDAPALGDEESGVVEQPVAPTSSAADLALNSLNDHKPPSPQGQKRSIDEIGDGTDDAPDSTDAKRPRM